MAFSLETTKSVRKKKRKEGRKGKKENLHKRRNSALIEGSLCGFQRKVAVIVVSANDLLALQSETAVNCGLMTVRSTVGCAGNC